MHVGFRQSLSTWRFWAPEPFTSMMSMYPREPHTWHRYTDQLRPHIQDGACMIYTNPEETSIVFSRDFQKSLGFLKGASQSCLYMKAGVDMNTGQHPQPVKKQRSRKLPDTRGQTYGKDSLRRSEQMVEQIHTERDSLTAVIWISGTNFVRPIAQCVIGCRRNTENSEYGQGCIVGSIGLKQDLKMVTRSVCN